MSSLLLDAFRHNAWATKTLLNVCRDLSDEQLEATTPGVFGGIRATLQHLILSEGGYHRLITGIAPKNWPPDNTALNLVGLEARADELAELWETALGQDIDVDRIIQTRGDDGSHDTAIGVVVAQVLVHGNEHRGQVCTVLTTLGVEPPELGAWEYALESGRMTPRTGAI